jgi:hypothetical protein
LPRRCTRSFRFALDLALVLLLGLGVACSGGGSDGGESLGGGGGGSGGSGGSGNPPPDPDPDPDPVPTPVPSLEATLGWQAASGPVAGYSVMVSRNGGRFQLERQTPVAQVLVNGAVGDVVKIRVAAYDGLGNAGPASEPSYPIVFTGQPAPTEPASNGDSGSAEQPGDDPGSVAGGGDAGTDPTPDPSTDPTPTDPGEDPAPNGPRRHADFDGDGAADLVWETADGSAVRISRADLSSARLYTLPVAGARVAAIADFDADGLTDLLFSAAGELALARGSEFPDGPGELALETWATPEAGFSVLASGDFDADGSADAVVLESAGASLWLAAGNVLALPTLGSATLAGAGDGDGDGSDDLIVGEAQSFALWRVVGGEVSSVTALPTPENATLLGVADLDGDGAAELALRGAADAMTVLRAQAPFGSWLEPAPAGSTLVGCGDYDADGVADRVFAGADSLQVFTSSDAAQVVPLDAASPWRIVPDCQ